MGRFIYKFRQHFFVYHSWKTSNFESTYKKPSFIKKVAIFSDSLMYMILVSNYQGCKGEAINLIPHCLIDIINKTENFKSCKSKTT